VNQAYPSGPYGGPVAAAGLADHDLRMVDTDDQSAVRSGGEGGDGHARTAAEFDDVVGRLDVEKLHRPAVARHVRRAPAHDPAGEVPCGSGRVVELCQPSVTSPPSHHAVQHPLLDVHAVSTPLRVRLKSMPATERTLASSVTPTSLSIGELSELTGVPTTTLRYYDERGLVRPAARAAGRRRYAASAVRDVGVIVFFREIGFSLTEIGRFIAGGRQRQQEMIDRKLAELAEQQHRIEVARTALEHGRQCPASEPMKCSRFWSIIEARQRGLPLEESHARAH
jgi:DNA-binding transcriptional MerR regulator